MSRTGASSTLTTQLRGTVVGVDVVVVIEDADKGAGVSIIELMETFGISVGSGKAGT